MNTLLSSIFFLLAILHPLAAEEPQLILNMSNQQQLPKNFRIAQDLQASGSGQFSALALEEMLKILPKDQPIFIVDLRQESHGFADGMAISWRQPPKNWGNLGKTLSEIVQDESERLQKLAQQKVALICKNDLIFPIFVRQAITEEQLVKDQKQNYLRIPVTDHRKPSANQVDRFILAIRNLPNNAWVHYHCSAGKGRSTAFLAMYDMLRNAKKDSLDTILERQYRLGGVNYLADKTSQDWKQSDYLKKQKFLHNFYEYCRESDPFTVIWSEWLSKSRLKISAP